MNILYMNRLKENVNNRHFMILLVLSLLLISGCTDFFNNRKDVDKKLRKVIKENNLTGDASRSRDLPSIDSPKAQLGMQLFFTKALGGDMDSACVTCHHPAMGGGDNLSLSIGTEAVNPDLLGPGRSHSPNGTHFDGGPTVPRNAPSTYNIGLWDVVLFLDGRVESLDQSDNANGQGDRIRTPDTVFGSVDNNAGDNLTVAQARFPVTSPEEMRGFTLEAGHSNDAVRNHLAARLRNEIPAELMGSTWLEAFRAGFNQPNGSSQDLITFANIVDAIGTYERSQVFVNNPWKTYVEGDNNGLTDAQKRGALLFFEPIEEGGASCSSCHSGDFFSDEKFHNIAMPQIGRGKGDNNGSTTSADFGRFRETGDHNDLYAFRTPTLLNVEVTGPWGHDGAYTSLEGIVRHHLNPDDAILNYNLSQLTMGIQTDDWGTNTLLALQVLQQRRSEGLFALQDVYLSEEEIGELVEFLKALTDLCVKSRDCIAPWIPGASLPDPDNLRLNAVDKDGNPL
jgi:cytochrome c peroxidase